jgi:hypothetical protein
MIGAVSMNEGPGKIDSLSEELALGPRARSAQHRGKDER